VANFDRVFDPDYSGVDLFTGRGVECEVFERALVRHVEQVLAGSVTLEDVARRNVLTFYGIAGIGKTELSRHLERWLLGEPILPAEWGDPLRFDQDVRTVRIDFHGSGVVDAADLVLRLRAAASGSARRFAAFDLGFAAWWAHAHPGTPLPQVRSSAGADVRGQMTDTLNDILSDAGLRFGAGPLTVRMGIRLGDAIRSHRLRGVTLRQCAPLAAVIEQAREDASPYVAATLAGLLSWDLRQLHPAQTPLIVAFADAAEYIQAADRSQERLFNRVVYLTPQILWVITSRNRRDWYSTELIGTFPSAGPRMWPELSPDVGNEPCQHVVGDLPDADVLRYLRAASGSGGNPELGSEVIDRVRHGAHGLPLYLDLSMALAREVGQASDRSLDPDTFGGSLPQLVIRIFADLPDVERDVARAASLLPRFDPSLVAQAARVLLGDAERFCRKSLVSRDDHPLFPFRLHDAVRLAIADEPITSQGAWATADRAACAGRLLEALRARHDELPGINHRREILELTAGLCTAYDLHPPWLRRSLTDLPGLALTAALLPPPDDDTWIGQVSGFFQAWQCRSLRERIDYLTRFVSTTHEEDIDTLARRWLAYCLRDTQGDTDQALAIFQGLLSRKPESQLLRYQVARTLRQLGRYEELDEHLNRYPLSEPTAAARMRSDLAYDRGDIVEAVAGAAARASYLRSIGNHRTALENASAALWRAALIRRASVADCDARITEADQCGARSIIRTALAAKIVCLGGDDTAARESFAEIAAIISAPTAKPARPREWAAAIIHDLHTKDDHRIQEVRHQWDGLRIWSPERQFVDRLFVYAGYQPTYPPLDIGADNNQKIGQRWHAVIDTLVRYQ
jgi:tetratricopeptide (TPR) repeat protein